LLKTCCRCKTSKDESEFYRNEGDKSGLQSRCKLCMSLEAKVRWAKMPPVERAMYSKLHRDPEVQKRAEVARKARKEADLVAWAASKAKWNEARRIKRKTNNEYRKQLSLAKKCSVHRITVEEAAERESRPCGICGTFKEPVLLNAGYVRGRMHIDHCHKTGRVRGTLCNDCNRALGLFADSPDRLRAAALYIESWSVL